MTGFLSIYFLNRCLKANLNKNRTCFYVPDKNKICRSHQRKKKKDDGSGGI